MSKLNINAKYFTPTRHPTLSVQAAQHTFFLPAAINTTPSRKPSRGSHKKAGSSRNRPGKDKRLAQPPSLKAKTTTPASPTPEPKPYGPLTESLARRLGWSLEKINNRKGQEAEKSSAASSTSRFSTPSSTPKEPWHTALGKQNPRAWTGVSGIGNGAEWGTHNGKGYGGVMYSRFRDMTPRKFDEQKQFAEKNSREMGSEKGPAVGPAIGFQKAYKEKGWAG